MKRLLSIIGIGIVLLAATCPVQAEVSLTLPNGATSQSIYLTIRDNYGDPNTAVVVTTLDLYTIEQGAAIAAKVDCTALAAADSAYSSGGAYHCGYGVVRIDLPNTALDGGYGKSVKVVVASAGNQQAEATITLNAQTGDAYVPALAAQTAAELWNSPTKARTILTGENKALAKEETLTGLDALLDTIDGIVDEILAEITGGVAKP
jgi:hypothetical protein